MKKLIKYSEDHYILVDDSKIEIGDIVCEKLLNISYKLFTIHTLNDIDLKTQLKVTHSTQSISFVPMNRVDLISILEIEKLIYGYNAYELFKKFDGTSSDDGYEYWLFKKGFKAHQELVKDKLFTIEDMQLLAAELIGRYRLNEIKEVEDVQKIIDSRLPKTEWDIEIIDGKIKLI